ncbi:hypothetical protein GQ44DRAFT_608204 [Phaeosphaeriaceae sp. PMI808]|nr:hypothetical protein GQ44DRAFT_608204 [Phaeosphaeriaceae sp. PMI808]
MDLSALISNLREYLTIEEESQIHQRFLGSQWTPNSQVLWSGITRETAQGWADKHNMQTLTTAMGPLMDKNAPLCLKRRKSKVNWSKYMKGASAVFAWYITKGEKVTVLSPPPPEKFHPSGLTTYQAIEEPILKWAIASGSALQIEMVHPIVKGAENFRYLVWPVDQTATWVAAFGIGTSRKRRWRAINMNSRQLVMEKAIEASEGPVVRDGAKASIPKEPIGRKSVIGER